MDLDQLHGSRPVVGDLARYGRSGLLQVVLGVFFLDILELQVAQIGRRLLGEDGNIRWPAFLLAVPEDPHRREYQHYAARHPNRKRRRTWRFFIGHAIFRSPSSRGSSPSAMPRRREIPGPIQSSRYRLASGPGFPQW